MAYNFSVHSTASGLCQKYFSISPRYHVENILTPTPAALVDIINITPLLTFMRDYFLKCGMIKFPPRALETTLAVLVIACMATLASGPAHALELKTLIAPCSACHDTERICRNLDRGTAFWTDTVIRMKRNGAKLDDDRTEALVLLLSGRTNTNPATQLGCLQPSEKTRIPVAARLLHPIFMGLTLLLALWVAYQGVNRVRFSLFKQKVAFNWKAHTKYGLAVLSLWVIGMAAGSLMTSLAHGTPGVTGFHRATAIAMLPLIVFGAVSGLYMDKKKRPRRILPILHGAANMILLAMALSQSVTGLALVWAFFQP